MLKEKYAKWWLMGGVLIAFVLPYLLTRKAFFSALNFTETGEIGDTIGGIAGPILNLVGILLVYFTLKAQMDANEREARIRNFDLMIKQLTKLETVCKLIDIKEIDKWIEFNFHSNDQSSDFHFLIADFYQDLYMFPEDKQNLYRNARKQFYHILRTVPTFRHFDYIIQTSDFVLHNLNSFKLDNEEKEFIKNQLFYEIKEINDLLLEKFYEQMNRTLIDSPEVALAEKNSFYSKVHRIRNFCLVYSAERSN